ncbi:hypothetical protein, conserved [Trypanosoma brucei gambiense DAL972]|uniref:Sfi1 spindle body domain-containing protein n=1 Tax=Trypanosoma brucei gambiense (strain MHOM/CI/86/DAL972) TaxID=679716 RepID=C9ZYW1_TRYB9|nr:hypothetical protein, conserved [Trypanosoma brucei gambiense DAL972]CBH14610.1 hypothetical protein, conserved [Trypanosoma brucei gambiense DAL972]|eukprot:XP_011776876.1 hypothetical protein, conserved [Trypanosoma brucei gambiense DAL972]
MGYLLQLSLVFVDIYPSHSLSFYFLDLLLYFVQYLLRHQPEPLFTCKERKECENTQRGGEEVGNVGGRGINSLRAWLCMDADLNGLRKRLVEAHERVGRMTFLMLRAVLQHIAQRRPRAAVSSVNGLNTSAELSRVKSSATRDNNSRGHTAEPATKRGRAVAVDQAKLSRDFYRAALEAARQRAVEEHQGASTAMSDGQEGDEYTPSVALLLLQTARERAIKLAVFLRFRLAAVRGQQLNEECELRFSYYLLRRVVRAWNTYTLGSFYRRRQMITYVVGHWCAVTWRNRRMREHLQIFRDGLLVRRQAFNFILLRRLRRYFVQWLQRLETRRVIRDLEERAADMRRKHTFVTVAYPNGRPSAFVVKNRVFAHWKNKTEYRLDGKLAELISNKSLMKRAWSNFVRRYNALVNIDLGAPCLPREQQLLVVHVEPQVARLMLLKIQCARQIARECLKRFVFSKWRSLYARRVADSFFVYQRRLGAMKMWLEALRRRRLDTFVMVECWRQWRHRFLCRVRSVHADYWRRCRYMRRPFVFWRCSAAAIRFHHLHIRRWCMQHWWQRVARRVIHRRMCASTERRIFMFWRSKAAVVKSNRMMLCVADSLRELVVLLGCFRRWRQRHEDSRRVHLSESILSELRREKQRASLFNRWKRLTFWPRPAVGFGGELVD